jgi:hypothetical protein
MGLNRPILLQNTQSLKTHTRREAIEAIQELASDRLNNVEIVPLEITDKKTNRENPWIEFIGMFEGDAEFAEIATQLRVERAQNTDNEL